MTPEEAKALIRVLVVGLPFVRFPSESIEIYEQAIADLEVGVAQQAVEDIIQTWELARVPPVSEIRKGVGRILAQRLGEVHVPTPAAPKAGAELSGPEHWRAVLPGMIEREKRHRNLVNAERRRRRLEPLKPKAFDPCPFLEMAKRGANGEELSADTMTRMLKSFGFASQPSASGHSANQGDSH